MTDALLGPHWLKVETVRSGVWVHVIEEQTDESIDQIELRLRILAERLEQPYRAKLNGVRVVECWLDRVHARPH